jgi:trigger factor
MIFWTFAEAAPVGTLRRAEHERGHLKVEYSEETPVRKSLSFEIEPEVVEQEIETRAKHYAKRVKIPGFRPGKIPVAVIKQRFRGQVMEDVVESLVNKSVFDELESRGLRPLSTPKVQDLKIEDNKPLTFRAVFETLPPIELHDYKGLEIKVRAPRVADDAVEKELERLREDAARYDAVESRPLKDGDFAVLDVQYTRDDGTRKHDENVLVEVGADANHKDLNEALAGMSPGDSKTVSISYEADDKSEGLAGRTVEYALTLKAVKTKVIPAADDEFAKDLGEFGSLAELKDKLRQQLLSADERRVEHDTRDALVDALIARASFDVPEALVERHMAARTRSAAEGLAMRGIDPSKAGLDWKQFHDAQREAAVRGARADILLDEIARREGITVPDSALEDEIGRLAERMKRPKEAVRQAMEKEGEISALRARMREDLTLDLLKANARIDTE